MTTLRPWTRLLSCAAGVLLLSLAEARSQAGGAPGPDPLRLCRLFSDPKDLLDRSFGFAPAAGVTDIPHVIPAVARSLYEYGAKGRPASEDLAAQPERKQVPSGGTILITLKRPDGILPQDWRSGSVYGAAQTERSDDDDPTRPAVRVPVGMSVRDQGADAIVVSALVPDNPSLLSSETWTVVPVLCGGPQNKILGYGSTKLKSVSTTLAWMVAVALVLVVWLGATVASYQIYGKKLESLWKDYGGWARSTFPDSPVAKTVWKCVEAANPVFISQDSLGFGSFARFQLLFFTSVVGFVLCYIFMHSGVLSELSTTILTLLGVTAAGSTVGRVTGDWSGISSASRRWLVGGRILVQRDKPRWSDLLESQGELDVAKVQALLFSTLIAASIVASGYSGLGSFALPEQVVWLSLLSQGAYVFGKMLPTDTRKNLEEDLKGLRSAASALCLAPDDDQATRGYAIAVSAARITLDQTYGDRFDSAHFDAVVSDPRNIL